MILAIMTPGKNPLHVIVTGALFADPRDGVTFPLHRDTKMSASGNKQV
jgi:hypothetical protein